MKRIDMTADVDWLASALFERVTRKASGRRSLPRRDGRCTLKQGRAA